MSGLVESIGNVVARLWDGGQAFLWGCAAACVLVFALLFGGWYLGFTVGIAALSEYGLLLLCGVVTFTALAAARTWQGWPKRTLFFIPTEEQSLWGHSRQTSGEVFTSLNFRMAVTNLSDTAVHLSHPHIVWPLRARWCEEVTAMMTTEDPDGSNYHSQKYPIRPHAHSHASGVIALNGAVCKPGKRMTFVVSVVDHRGRRHRIRFKKLRATNSEPA